MPKAMRPAWRWPARCTGCVASWVVSKPIVRQEGQLSLDARLCWVDVWAVERLLGARRPGRHPESYGKPPTSTVARSSTNERSSCLRPRRWPRGSVAACCGRSCALDASASRRMSRRGGLVRASAPRRPVCRGYLPEPHECLERLERSTEVVGVISVAEPPSPPYGASHPPRRLRGSSRPFPACKSAKFLRLHCLESEHDRSWRGASVHT